MLTHHPRRKDLMIEGDFLPKTVEDLVVLRTRIVEAVQSGAIDEVKPSAADSVANGITGWLVAKASGQTDTLGPSTRAKYRKVLEVVRRDGGRRDRGSATLAAVTVIGTLASLAASGRPGVALALAPIIYVMSI